MATLGTFVTGQVVTAAELNAIGTYTAYTPTFTGFTLGNGTVTARYTAVNKLVHYLGFVDLGSTSTMTGPLDVALPLTCSTTAQPILAPFAGNVMFYNGGALFDGYPIQISSTSFRCVGRLVNATYSQNFDMSNVAPFSWGANSYFYWNFVYQAA